MGLELGPKTLSSPARDRENPSTRRRRSWRASGAGGRPQQARRRQRPRRTASRAPRTRRHAAQTAQRGRRADAGAGRRRRRDAVAGRQAARGAEPAGVGARRARAVSDMRQKLAELDSRSGMPAGRRTSRAPSASCRPRSSASATTRRGRSNVGRADRQRILQGERICAPRARTSPCFSARRERRAGRDLVLAPARVLRRGRRRHAAWRRRAFDDSASRGEH